MRQVPRCLALFLQQSLRQYPARPKFRIVPGVSTQRSLSSRRGVTQADLERLEASLQPQTRKIQDPLLAQYTLDEAIEATHVRVKDKATGKLGERQNLRWLLNGLDRDKEAVHLLSKIKEGEIPIVEVVQKQDLRDKVKLREQQTIDAQKAQRESKPKQIELNWAISENDLQIKLKQLEQFVQKGKRVEVLLANKKRARRATLKEGERVVSSIRNKLVDIDAKEIRPMEGKVLAQAIMLIKKRTEE